MKSLIRIIAAGAVLFVGATQAQTFCNSASIAVPGTGTSGPASPYPSVVNVSGVAGTIGTMSVDIRGLSHTFPDDIDMLLVAPGGQTLIIQSDVGGNVGAVNINYKLRDTAAGVAPDAGPLVSGQYRPTDVGTGDTFVAPAPVGPYGDPAPNGAATFASVFAGTNPNGTWTLYVVDDAGGDIGSIGNGWCLNFGNASPLRISEFRLRGPNGANDEFVELANISGSDTMVGAPDGSAGFALAASDGVARCVIPNGTLVPAMAHFLCANSVGYALVDYPGATTTTPADLTYATDIPDNAGVALFRTATPGSFNPVTRIDAVGSSSEANTTYKLGTGYPALTPFSIEYSWVRDACGKGGSITILGDCPTGGVLKDTGNNAADFYFVDTNGTSAGGGQRLGAPGPEDLASPTWGTGDISSDSLDTCAARAAAPNIVRDFTSVPAQNSTFGTLDIRRTFTNNTGATLIRLRFRIIDLTTFPAPSNVADMRPITSADISVLVDRPPCGSGTSSPLVAGTTLEKDNTAPSTGQPNGGGFNSSMGVNVGAGIAAGASIDVRFLLGLQQTGQYKFAIIAEGLPKGGGVDQIYSFTGCTDGCTGTDLIFVDGFDD
jgi:subtilisin-like proprotein convertase family protein